MVVPIYETEEEWYSREEVVKTGKPYINDNTKIQKKSKQIGEYQYYVPKYIFEGLGLELPEPVFFSKGPHNWNRSDDNKKPYQPFFYIGDHNIHLCIEYNMVFENGYYTDVDTSALLGIELEEIEKYQVVGYTYKPAYPGPWLSFVYDVSQTTQFKSKQLRDIFKTIGQN